MALTLWSDVERGLTNTELDTNFSELAAGGLSQTASDNRPLVKPSLNLDFTKGVLDPRITFTRASTGTYYGADGLLKTAGVNEPRFEYDPVTRQPKGLLIEEQRTNLLTYSEQFNNAAWSKINGAAISADVEYSPNSTLSADLFYPASTGNFRFVGAGGSFTAGQSYTFSVFVKPAGKRYVVLYGDSSILGYSNVFFDLQMGVVSQTGGSAPPTITKIGAWYRITYTVTPSSTGSATIQIGTVDASGSWMSTASGTSGIYIWGAQLEQGSFATSYIPTTTAQVLRSADVASITGANFASWYRQDEGTFGVKAIPIVRPSTSDYYYAYMASTGNVNQAISFSNDTNWNGPRASFSGFSATNTPTASGSEISACHSYFTTGMIGSVNGVASTITGSVSTNYTMNKLDIGSGNGVRFINGYIRKLSYYPVRLTNTQLQQLTSTV